MTNPLTRATAVVRPATGLIPSLGGASRDRLTTTLQYVGLAVVLVLLVALPYLGLAPYYVNITTTTLCSALLAASVNFLLGQAGLVSMGQAGISTVAMYGVAWGFKQGWDLGGQLLLALVLTLVVSAIFGIVSMRTSGIYFMMVTLAAGMLVFGLAYSMSSITAADTGISVDRPGDLNSRFNYWQWYYLALAVFIVGTAILWVVSRSPFGASLRGIRDSESRMRSLGYNVAAYKVGAFMISGFVAGMAGVITLWNNKLVTSDSASITNSTLPIIVLVLGGVGTLLGPLVGAIVVTFFSIIMPSFFERWETLLGVVFILVIMFARAGIVGGLGRLYRWIRRRTGGSVRTPDVGTPVPTSNHRTTA